MPDDAHPHEDAMSALAPLPRGSSGRDVLDALARMIETVGLGIGDRLPPEVDLARRLGVSRPKVREALTAWAGMGIVTRNKRAGTRLAAEVTANAIHMPLTVRIEAESLLRTLAVRRPLEIEAARLAARCAGPEARRLIAARCAALMASHAAGEDWRPADHRFHEALHAGSGNPLFGQLIGQIQRGFAEVYEAPFGRPHLGQETIPLHADLAEAVLTADADGAGRQMARIMDMVEAEVRETSQALEAGDGR